MKILSFFFVFVVALSAQAEIKIASLHPLMGDLANQVGGERVSVVAIGKPGMDVHTFAPTAKDLQAMASCQLVVASGKGLETYLSSLSDSLGAVPILEVGSSIPSRTIDGEEAHAACCPDHHHHHHGEGAIDPHWWHDVSNMERAVKIVEKQLVKMDPEGKELYQSRSKEARDRYQKLDQWVKAEVASIPESQRKLVTAHSAFGYFCEAYNLEAVFVLGLSGDHEVPAKQLAEEVVKLKEGGIKAVFPEKNLNPKVLSQVAKQAGAITGQALVADGASTDYETMIRKNVSAIVSGLTS